METPTNSSVRPASSGAEESSGNPKVLESVIEAIYGLEEAADLRRVRETLNEWEQVLEAAAEADAASPETSAVRLAVLSTYHRYTVRKAVAANPNTSVETLKKMMEDTDDEVRMRIAGHPNATPEMLWKLLWEDGRRPIREALADNQQAPVELLEELFNQAQEGSSRSAGEQTRMFIRLGRNPATPPRLLIWIAGHELWMVRDAVRANSAAVDDTEVALAVKLCDEYAGRPDELAKTVKRLLA